MATISFARGVPAPECLPVDELADCARVALERDGKTILSYGASSGYGPLREWLAARHDVEPGRIFITNGSLQGFVFLAQRLAVGKRVLVERPTYDRPLKILREIGADVVGLHCDDQGLDPDALEEALKAGEKPAFVYLIPTFQNPSGRTLSEERRTRIVELALEHDVLLLEDDPYSLVRFEGEPLPSLFELSGGETAYSSSFSKTIAPGLRVGWFVLPEPLERELELAANGTYIGPVLLGQAAAYEFVSRGLFEPHASGRRLLPLGRARGRRRDRVARSRGGSRSDLREGNGLRRRTRHAAPRVQLRLGRRDRRRRLAASGGACCAGIAARAGFRPRSRSRAGAGSRRSSRPVSS